MVGLGLSIFVQHAPFKSIAKMSPVDVLRQMNLWLVSCLMSTDLCEARTTLIPKVVGATEPSKFRPITVSSLLTRLYYRIVAKRIEALCPCSERQKAFRRSDGIAENVFLCGPAYPQSHSAEDAEAALPVLHRCRESI